VADGVGLPCALQRCGDVVYRSTLDAKLRGEEDTVTREAVALLLAALGYLSVTPGALAGFFDYYVLAPLARRAQPRASLDDYDILSKLGEGGFGTVWRGVERRSGREVVLKCATGFGEEERWMNERAARACAGRTAAFLTSFRDPRPARLPAEGPGASFSRALAGALAARRPAAPSAEQGDSQPLWLVWALEGTQTLAELMSRPDFPYCCEEGLFGYALAGPTGPRRAARSVRALTAQLLAALSALHGTGIVHRDVKPENLVWSTTGGPGRARLLLVDLGAAADLRVGVNYAPRLFVLDPRYAAPEQYVMSTQTPVAPPVPLALLLSPTLWQLNAPDRFDTYAVGLVLLQMALPGLRPDSALISLRRQLERPGCDLEGWRESAERRGGAAAADGFALLDEEGGAGWELVLRTVRMPPSRRLSAAAAARHRFVAGGAGGRAPLLRALESALEAGGEAVGDGAAAPQMGWLLRRITRASSFTEAQMEQLSAVEGDKGRPPTESDARRILVRERSRVMQTLTGVAPAAKKRPVVARRPLPEDDESSAAKIVRARGEGALRTLLDKLNLNLFARAE